MIQIDDHIPGDDFDAVISCLHKFARIGRIDFGRRGKPARIHPLNQIEYHPPVTGCHQVSEFIQMFLSSLGHRVRKQGRAVLHQGAVLDFHITVPATRRFQGQVQPGAFRTVTSERTGP